MTLASTSGKTGLYSRSNAGSKTGPKMERGRGFRSATFSAFDVPAAEKRDRFEAALRVILAALPSRKC